MTVGLLFRLLSCAKPHSTAVAPSGDCLTWHLQKEFAATHNFCKIASIFGKWKAADSKRLGGHSAALRKRSGAEESFFTAQRPVSQAKKVSARLDHIQRTGRIFRVEAKFANGIVRPS